MFYKIQLLVQTFALILLPRAWHVVVEIKPWQTLGELQGGGIKFVIDRYLALQHVLSTHL